MIGKLTNLTKKELFLKAYKEQMCNISKACETINISRQAYYDWLDKYPKFKQQIHDIEESLTDMAECQLYKNVKSGMQKAVEFYLTNRKKDKYNNNLNLEVTVPKVIDHVVFVQQGEPPVIEDK